MPGLTKVFDIRRENRDVHRPHNPCEDTRGLSDGCHTTTLNHLLHVTLLVCWCKSHSIRRNCCATLLRRHELFCVHGCSQFAIAGFALRRLLRSDILKGQPRGRTDSTFGCSCSLNSPLSLHRKTFERNSSAYQIVIQRCNVHPC